MTVYLAAVRSLHVSHGLSNPLQPGLPLKQTLRGIERKHFSARKQKIPLTFNILSDIQALIIPTCDDDTVRWAAITAGHFLMLRAGEFYSSFSRPFRPVYSPHLLWHTFTFLSSGTEYHSLPLINLNGSATTGFDSLYCSFRLCWLRYEKESRSSPSPWYCQQSYYALVSPFPTNAPSAKYPSSLLSLTYYVRSVLTPSTTVVIVFESEEQRPPPSLA